MKSVLIFVVACLFSGAAHAEISLYESTAGFAVGSKSGGIPGKNWVDGETAFLNGTMVTLPGYGYLTPTGYTFPMIQSQAPTTDSHGNLVSSAASYITSSSTFTSGNVPSVTVNISANTSATANGSGAQAWSVNGGQCNAITTSLIYNVTTPSVLKATGMTASNSGIVSPPGASGNATGTATWTIAIMQNGNTVASYTNLNSGATVNATIPANSQVLISWRVSSSATSNAYGVNSEASGAVTGTVTIK